MLYIFFNEWMKIKALSEKIEIDSEIGRRFLKTIIKEKTVIIFVLAFKGTNPFLMEKNSKKNSKMPPSDKTINIEGIKRGGSSCS